MGQNAVMESTPLGRGDLHWVFPELDDTEAVRAALAGADAQVRSLAEHLGARAGRTGTGLEFLRAEGIPVGSLFGSVELPEVSFFAALYFPRRCAWDLRWGPPWLVEVGVTVPCDRTPDCEGHTVAEREGSYDSPIDAARGLRRATAWLLAQGVGSPPDSWRSRDEGCPYESAG